MLVKELIHELQKCDADKEVCVAGGYTTRHCDFYSEIDCVQETAIVDIIVKDLDFPFSLDGN
jgi:hypothetical protein